MIDRRELLTRTGGGALLFALPDELLAAAQDWLDAHPSLSRRALRALRGAVRGPVLTGGPAYASARRVYNQRFAGIRPEAVVQPLDVRDVQAVVRWADRFGVRLVARSGGHSYAGYSTVRNGVVVGLRRLRGSA